MQDWLESGLGLCLASDCLPYLLLSLRAALIPHGRRRERRSMD